MLHERFGGRFACFGAGWEGFPFAREPVPYHQQGEANRRAWVTVGWDHFTPTPFYSSDRLPIALASGVVHVTSYQPGYDVMFPREHGLYWGRSVREVLDVTTWLVEQSRDYLLDRGSRAASFARSRLNQHDQYADLVADMATLRSQLRSSSQGNS
jgi:hypothetical protein